MKKLLFLCYFTVVHLIALLLFCNGFLLTRISLDDVTQAHPSPIRPRFQKAVILVIDALRHDFTVPQNASSPYWNHLTALYNVAQDSPCNAFLAKFIADPPTTTLQRLKGLTTGSLPTFVDAGSNFAGEKITEDNLLLQLRASGKRIAFVGDDTWQALFPDSFAPDLNHPFESLNVWDLDTVDDGVHHHLFEAEEAFFAQSVRPRWDVLIAHALGLDHAGHRYGPDHAETTRKLQQMNDWVQEIMSSIDDSTLLVIMGDHGMNPQGDHGGDSVEELEAALFMYAKTDAFQCQHDALMEVAQIDFVSTFALLMGLSVPFNNLGAPIPHAFPHDSSVPYSTALQSTTDQIENYINRYSELSASTKQSIDNINERHSESRTRSGLWQKDVLRLFRHQWAQYHLPSIAYGLIQMLTIFILLTGSLLFPEHDLLQYSPSILLLEQLYSLLMLRTLLPLSYLLSGLLLSVGALILWYLSFDARNLVVKHWTWRFQDYPALLGLVMHSATFASNSFTIHEDRISLFILCTLLTSLMLGILGSDQSPRSKSGHLSMIVGVGILARVAASIRLCREEQIGSCTSNFYQLSAWITQPCNAVVSISATIYLKLLASDTSNLTRGTRRWVDFGFALPQLFSWIFWLLDHSDVLPRVRMFIGRVILIVGIGQLVGWYWLALPVSFAITQGTLHAQGSGNYRAISTLQLILPMLSILTFLGRSAGSLSLTILLLQLTLLTTLHASAQWNGSKDSGFLVTMICVELMFLHFFSTGHQMALPFIQWDLAFLASSRIIYPLSPLLILGNAFGSFCIVALWIPVLTQYMRRSSALVESTTPETVPPSEAISTSSNTARMFLSIMLALTLITFSTMLFATHFRRHLMVWKIFAPRFMTAGLILLITDLVFVFSSFGMVLNERKIVDLRKLLNLAKQAG